MKRITFIIASLICMSFSALSNAQNSNQTAKDVYLVPNPETAKWSYIQSDENGNPTSTSYYSIESLTGDGVNGLVKMLVEEVFVNPSVETTKDHVFYRFKDGEYMLDMDAILESDALKDATQSAIDEEGLELTEEQMKEVYETIKQELNISGEVRGIPRYPQVGKLPDFEFRFKIFIANVKMSGEKRRIVGTERIETNAGTFDCFVMEETLVTKAMLMKEVEKTKSWFAYGIGLVKEITYDKNDKVISTVILNEINW